MNLLIVDDQPNIISSLLAGIQWRALGIANVHTALSSASARNIILNHEINILLTDIEMPIENGIALLSWVREQKIELECIFLTSHTDFFFAQQAIGLRAIEYVVQPAKNEDIIRAIENAKLRCLQKQKTTQLLKANKFASVTQNMIIRKFIEKSDDDFMDTPLALHDKLEQFKDLDIHYNPNGAIVILHVLITHWHRLPQKAPDFLLLYQAALSTALAGLPTEPLSYYRNESSFITLIFSEATEELKAHIKIFHALLKENSGCQSRICLCQSTMTQAGSAVRNTVKYLEGHTLYEILPNEDCIEIIQHEPASNTMPDVTQSHEKHFKEIKRYIRTNLSRSISRIDIAHEFFLSPDYISFIVKSCTGLTCTELITHEKMAYAKKMLETTDLPVGDIAQKLGYDSFAYFSKVYKNTFNITPRATRK